MARFIPKEKLSKKARKELAAQQRATWAFSPVTKKIESKKLYNRNRKSHAGRDDVGMGFCFMAAQFSVKPALVSHAARSMSRPSDRFPPTRILPAQNAHDIIGKEAETGGRLGTKRDDIVRTFPCVFPFLDHSLPRRPRHDTASVSL